MLPAKVTTQVMEALCTLLVIGLQPLFLPHPLGRPVPCLYFVTFVSTQFPPLCSTFLCTIKAVSLLSAASALLPSPRGRQDTPGFLGSAHHTSCSAFNSFFLRAVPLSLPVLSLPRLKSFEIMSRLCFLLTTKTVL